MIPIGFRPIWFKPPTRLRRLAPLTMRDVAALLIGVDVSARHNDGPAIAKRAPVADDLRRFGDPNVEVAMRHRDGGNLYVLTDHDGSASRIHDDARGNVRLDQKIADFGHETGRSDPPRLPQCRLNSDLASCARRAP